MKLSRYSDYIIVIVGDFNMNIWWMTLTSLLEILSVLLILLNSACIWLDTWPKSCDQDLLAVHHTRLRTKDDRAFGEVDSRLWIFWCWALWIWSSLKKQLNLSWSFCCHIFSIWVVKHFVKSVQMCCMNKCLLDSGNKEIHNRSPLSLTYFSFFQHSHQETQGMTNNTHCKAMKATLLAKDNLYIGLVRAITNFN